MEISCNKSFENYNKQQQQKNALYIKSIFPYVKNCGRNVMI